MLNGVTTIRCFSAEQRFAVASAANFDIFNTSGLILAFSFNWLALRLEIIGSTTMAFIAAVAIYNEKFVPAGWIGLALAFAVELTSYLKQSVKMMAGLEGAMASIERIMHFSNDITEEAEEVVEHTRPAEAWPQLGVVEFKDYQMRYRPGLPLVLKGISFATTAKEAIGVCGRTGSGKSSLMVALFRTVEAASGSILIDGVDVSTIGLRQLREKLTIIPQDPVLFSRSVRFNIDPLGEHTDDAIWAALRKCHLDTAILALPGNLEQVVAEGGESFSVGERQLMCFARAILRSTKILLLDEATASIDNDTDALIQRMMRVDFRDRTTITIAHRLHTILDSDRVLAMDGGRIAEFDAPKALLRKPGGAFKGLCDAAGIGLEDCA
jgi:ATP-binding cassette subfamily C (CFTR/MRP) protein 1